MAQAARLSIRMQKELKLLLTDPPPGVSFPFLSPDSDVCSLSTIDAQIEGPEESVYSKGIFHIKMQIPERYPFQPPNVTFATPIYHPNIDNGGRICLDILNLPPKGAWQPSLNISTVMTSIGLLLSEPNPDDGLMCEMSREYKYNRCVFDQKARAMTEKYAKAGACGNSSKIQSVQTSADVDGEQSDKESKNVVYPNHSRPCGISRKLSLAPSRSTHNEGSNKEANVELDFTNLGAKIEREKLSHKNLSCERLCGESSIQFLKRVDHDMKDQEAKHSYPHCNGVSLPMASKELPLHKNGNAQHFHLHQDNELPFDNKTISSNKPFEVSQKILESLDEFQTSDGKTTFPVRKKLSLGRRGLPEGQRKDEKENIFLTNKLPHSNPKDQMRTEIMQKQPVNQLKRLPCNKMYSVKLHTDETRQNYQTGILTERIYHQRDGIPVPESVIVLDSEDSEDEGDVAARTKLSIVRKRIGKRKTQT